MLLEFFDRQGAQCFKMLRKRNAFIWLHNVGVPVHVKQVVPRRYVERMLVCPTNIGKTRLLKDFTIPIEGSLYEGGNKTSVFHLNDIYLFARSYCNEVRHDLCAECLEFCFKWLFFKFTYVAEGNEVFQGQRSECFISSLTTYIAPEAVRPELMILSKFGTTLEGSHWWCVKNMV